MCQVRKGCVALLLALVIQTTALLRGGQRGEVFQSVRMKVYFINMDSSWERAKCLGDQLDRLRGAGSKQGWEIVQERFSAVTFSDACVDLDSCVAERPECFPTKQGFSTHGHKASEDEEGMTRAVWGNACSHLKILRKIEDERADFDYFLVLEDDVVVANGVLDSLGSLITNFQDHWSLIAIDTWSMPPRSPYPGDSIPKSATKGLPLTSISATESTYWGAQAWFFNSAHVPQFTKYFSSLPLMPADWLTKLPGPLHLGMWAFNPEKIQQMRFLSDTQLKKEDLASVCAEESDSDIAPGTENVKLPMGFSRVRRTTASLQSSSELVILGMSGSGAKELKNLIRETLEEPRHIKLCSGDVEDECGKVRLDFDPERWSELSELRGKEAASLQEVVAFVVVRHPFAVAEKVMYESSEQVCGKACQKMCQSSSKWARNACQWSANMASYANMSKAGIFKRVQFVRYEDIVELPDMVVGRVAEAINTPAPPDELKRGMVVDKLEYSDEGCQRLHDLCSGVDQGKLWEYGYHGCQMHTTTYADRIFEDFGNQPEFFNNCPEFDQWK